MNKKLKISVVICTRNRNTYLKKCIDTLLKQTYLPKEIIIVEDFSNEDENVFEFFKKEFSDLNFEITRNITNLFNYKTKIILLRNEKQSGIVKSRNLGIKVASGDIIAFLDDDSFARTNWLKNLVKNYKNKNVVGAGGPFIEIGRKVETPDKKIKRVSYFSKKEGRMVIHYRLKNLSQRHLLPKANVKILLGGNMSFRKDILLKIHGCDSRYTGTAYHEESDMSLRASRFGKLVFDPEAVTYHDSAKKGGNREIENFVLDNFLFYLFRNTAFFFLRHFGLIAGFKLLKNLVKRQINLLRHNQTGTSRTYLKLNNIKKSIYTILKGSIVGIWCWLRNRKKGVEFIFADPMNIEAYKFVITGSSAKTEELEKKTKKLKDLFKI